MASRPGGAGVRATTMASNLDGDETEGGWGEGGGGGGIAGRRSQVMVKPSGPPEPIATSQAVTAGPGGGGEIRPGSVRDAPARAHEAADQASHGCPLRKGG